MLYLAFYSSGIIQFFDFIADIHLAERGAQLGDGNYAEDSSKIANNGRSMKLSMLFLFIAMKYDGEIFSLKYILLI